MAYFMYGDAKPRYRIGIWLRVRHLSSSIQAAIAAQNPRDERVLWVVVQERISKTEVLLEVWCAQAVSGVTGLPDRFTVFYVQAIEDPDWVCESDLGRGLV